MTAARLLCPAEGGGGRDGFCAAARITEVNLVWRRYALGEGGFWLTLLYFVRHFLKLTSGVCEVKAAMGQAIVSRATQQPRILLTIG